MSADFICCGVQDGWRWVSSAATPATCGAEKLVPSRTAYWSPANSGSVDERICAPGAMTSGFSACPNGVSPGARSSSARPPRSSAPRVISRVKRTVTAPPRAGGSGADPRAVEVGDRPTGESGEERERRIAGTVLGDDHSRRRRPRARARCLRAVRTAAAADERDRAAQRARRERAVAQLPVHAADRPDVDEALVRRDPRRRNAVGGRERDAPDARPARRP